MKVDSEDQLSQLWNKMLNRPQNPEPDLTDQNFDDNSSATATGLNSFCKHFFGQSENNVYDEEKNPLEKIKAIIESGNLLELVQLLKAHLKKNSSDVKGWRSLGLIYQELDQDQTALKCFMISLRHDAHDRQSLLQLGLSSLNILDEIQTLKYIGKSEVCASIYDHLTFQNTPQLIRLKAVNRRKIFGPRSLFCCNATQAEFVDSGESS